MPARLQKNKKLYMALCVSAVFVCALLLVSVSVAKYVKNLTAYARLEAASFNVAIFAEGGESTGEIKLSKERFAPGMVWSDTSTDDTSAEFPFSVTNGKLDGILSGVGVRYTVRLRTGKSLPFSYVLKDMDGKVYKSGKPVKLEEETALKEATYEFVFYPVEGAEAEPEFRMDRNESSLVSHDFTLYVEWPSDTEEKTNAYSYMKETEIVEIVVTASNLNMLEESGYGEETKDPDTPPASEQPEYAGGLILLRPDETSYEYEIDLRSFRPAAADEHVNGTGVGRFDFSVDNGYGLGIIHTSQRVDYTMKLMMPYEELKGSFSFTLWEGELTQASFDTSTAAYGFRVYDDKNGIIKDSEGAEAEYLEFDTYDEIPSAYKPAETGDAKKDQTTRIYIVYDITLSEGSIVNIFDTVPRHGAKDYTLYMTGGADDVTGPLAFANKLTLFIEATYSGSTQTEETTAEETKAP